MAPSDRDVRAAVLGDQQARNVVGRWLDDELHEFFARRYRNGDMLADLLQSAMVVIWANESGKAPHDAAGLRTWAIGVTFTLGKAARRLARRDRHREGMHAHMPAPDQPLSPDSMVDLQAIAECVDDLSTPRREALIARVHGHTPTRIAAEQGVKPGAIRKRYSKAVDDIKQVLDHNAQARKDASEQKTPPKS